MFILHAIGWLMDRVVGFIGVEHRHLHQDDGRPGDGIATAVVDQPDAGVPLQPSDTREGRVSALLEA